MNEAQAQNTDGLSGNTDALKGRPSVCHTDGFNNAPIGPAIHELNGNIANLTNFLSRLTTPEPTPPCDEQPLVDLIAEYREAMALKGNRGITKHVRQTYDRLCTLALAANWTKFSQIDEPSLEAACVRVQMERKGREGFAHIGNQTLRHYYQAILQFTNWIHRKRKLVRVNPLYGVEKPEVRSHDVRHRRRKLSWPELALLIDTTRTAGEKLRLSGPDRAMLYCLAATTGFRKKEIGSLTKENFFRGKDGWSCTLSSKFAKNGKTVSQLIPEAFSESLETWLDTKSSAKLLWPISGAVPGGVDRNTAAMIRFDLKPCGIKYETTDGIVDFHALRATYISMLFEVGNGSDLVQVLARHSDVKLTTNVYNKVENRQLREAVNRIPSLTLGEPPRTSPPRLRLVAADS